MKQNDKFDSSMFPVAKLLVKYIDMEGKPFIGIQPLRNWNSEKPGTNLYSSEQIGRLATLRLEKMAKRILSDESDKEEKEYLTIELAERIIKKYGTEVS